MMNVAPGITISQPNTDFDERHACLVHASIPMQPHVSLAAIAEPQPFSPDIPRSSAYGQTDRRSRCPEETASDTMQMDLTVKTSEAGEISNFPPVGAASQVNAIHSR